MPQPVDFSTAVATWLHQHGAVAESALSPHPERADRVVLDAAAAASLRGGQGIRTLLASLYAAQGQLLPVDASALREGSTVAVRLANWNQLLPALKKFAVDFSADEKTLLIGGDSEALERVVELLHSRAGAGAAPAQLLPSPSAQKGPKKWARDFDADSMSALLLIIAQAAGVYAAIMASLFAIFVPQLCPPVPGEPATDPWHICTLHDNFTDLSKFNTLVVAVNFITLGVFVITQLYFGAREYWCIDAFDLDVSLPGDNLLEELELYPDFKDKLRRMNGAAYALALFLVVLVATNFVLSSILILRFYSAGKSSVTGLISGALLVAPRTLKWLVAARTSHVRGLPISLFSAAPVLPNTVDADWRFKAEVYRPDLTHVTVPMAPMGVAAATS